MKKVVILMPVHCAPKVAMMTLGSWLEACDGSYEAEIILGVHENYHHYHDGLQSLQDLPVSISFVPEMSWDCQNPADAITRYSKMHSISLKAMLERAGMIGFDHLAILDHDLVFKTDFVGWSMEQEADLVGSYLDDRVVSIHLETDMGVLVFAPKFSVWHMVMSSRFYQKVMEDVGIIFPNVKNGWFYDTFARVIEKNSHEWGLPIKEMKAADMEKMVKHLWSMSFNFGQFTRGVQDYWDRLAECEKVFDSRFPNGIAHLFKKVRL